MYGWGAFVLACLATWWAVYIFWGGLHRGRRLPRLHIADVALVNAYLAREAAAEVAV